MPGHNRKQTKKVASTPGTRGKSVSARECLEQSVRMNLRIVFSSAKKQFYEVKERCGVSGAQLAALMELKRKPGLRVSDLANLTCIRASTASNMLDKLEERKLIRRERADRDQRVVRLFLTPAGSRIVAMAPQAGRGVVPDALSNLGEATLNRLNGSLEELVSKLKIRDKSAIFKPLADI